MKKIKIILIIFFITTCSVQAQRDLLIDTLSGNQTRLALVIGNAEYLYVRKLKNPVNDADLMEKTFQKLNFAVLKYTDLTAQKMRTVIDDFSKKASSYDTILFYYAGHGIQLDGINYLVPVDADLQTEKEIPEKCVRFDRIFRNLDSTKTNIIILDACRNNNFRGFKKITYKPGLAYIEAKGETFIAFATAPGKTAYDGNGNNGLYTEILAKEIMIPNKTINEVFQETRLKVKEKSKLITGDEQIPWDNSSLEHNFYFLKNKNFKPDNNDNKDIIENSVFLQIDETTFEEKTTNLLNGFENSFNENEIEILETNKKANYTISINAKVKKKLKNSYGVYCCWLDISLKITDNNNKTILKKHYYDPKKYNLKGCKTTSFPEAAEEAYNNIQEQIFTDILTKILNQ